MNAAPPVFQAQPVSDAVQPDTPATAASAGTRPGSQDFAAALSDAGSKPVRKNASNKQPEPASSGSSMPAPGNQPPLAPTPSPPAKTDAAAAPATDGAAIKAAAASTPGPAPGGIALASNVPANASGLATTLAADRDPAALLAPGGTPASTPAAGSAIAPDPAVAPDAAVAPALAAAPSPAAGLGATTPSSDGPAVAGAGLTMPHAASMRTLAAPGPTTAATVAAAKSSDTGANRETNASGSSAPSSDANALNDSTSSNAPAASGTDAVAQAAMAAAIAQGTSGPADSSSSDDVAIPDTGVAPGVAIQGGAAGAPAAAFARASAASMVAAAATATAATAATIAQAISDAAGSSAADKRSHGSSADPSLSTAPNDGSVGAAQLLTSNTSTDSGMPMPTFKVAAGVDTAQFGQGVADRVSLMMDGNLTSAKLQVNPPALGPIEVRIALQGGHAQVSFSSHSAVTRDALESSSAKLREMLGSQGFSSVGVDISQRSFQERSPQSQAYESSPAGGADAPVVTHAALSMPRGASGLLDAYA